MKKRKRLFDTGLDNRRVRYQRIKQLFQRFVGGRVSYALLILKTLGLDHALGIFLMLAGLISIYFGR